MDRRSFFKFLGMGAATAVAEPAAVASLAMKEVEPVHYTYIYRNDPQLHKHMSLLHSALKDHDDACLHLLRTEYPSFANALEIVTGVKREPLVFCTHCGSQVKK